MNDKQFQAVKRLLMLANDRTIKSKTYSKALGACVQLRCNKQQASSLIFLATELPLKKEDQVIFDKEP